MLLYMVKHRFTEAVLYTFNLDIYDIFHYSRIYMTK